MVFPRGCAGPCLNCNPVSEDTDIIALQSTWPTHKSETSYHVSEQIKSLTITLKDYLCYRSRILWEVGCYPPELGNQMLHDFEESCHNLAHEQVLTKWKNIVLRVSSVTKNKNEYFINF